MIGGAGGLEKVMGGIVGQTLGVGGLLLVMWNLRAEQGGGWSRWLGEGCWGWG